MSGNLSGGTLFRADHELIGRAVAGNSDAQARLAECAREQVFSWSLRLVGDRQKAEDTTQEVLIRLWKHVGDLQDPSAFPSWLYKITLNACNSQLRSKPAGTLQEVDVAQHPDNSPSPEEVALARLEIDHMLGSLTESDRELLELKFEQGLTGKQIGKVLQTSEGAVRVRVHSVLKRLRDALGRGEDDQSLDA